MVCIGFAAGAGIAVGLAVGVVGRVASGVGVVRGRVAGVGLGVGSESAETALLPDRAMNDVPNIAADRTI